MGRRPLISDEELLARLGRAFRNLGYEGSSLAKLADESGLKKASLYHRFPQGKEQIAGEVLDFACQSLEQTVLASLRSDDQPDLRLRAMIDQLRVFYSDGNRACLLSMLSSPLSTADAFSERIKKTLETWISALEQTLEEAGLAPGQARQSALTSVALIQGSLVLARGMKSTQPFELAMEQLQRDLVDEARPH